MTEKTTAVVRRLWQYCNILRDDGLSYPDYVEQLTYILFLKMSDETDSALIPSEFDWKSFQGQDAEAMHSHYSRALSRFSSEGGMLGLIFRNAKNKVKDPAKLKKLMLDFIGTTEWSGLSADVKGDAYEGLLEKNARDTKSGAGQYFTPRPLIDAIVRCINPSIGERVCDPACGTGGFLLAAHQHMVSNAAHPSIPVHSTGILGVELVEEVARLAAMNFLLHGISTGPDGKLPIKCADSLSDPSPDIADVVLSNPPFGVKGSIKYSNGRSSTDEDDLTVVRKDFWVRTGNKQLNFIQHIASILSPVGRAAVIVPDNVLFEGGAAEVVRRRLLEEFHLHTLLRLPTGLFYAQGVKASVLFFDRGKPAPGSLLWVYDLRASRRYSLKTKPLQPSDMDEFVNLYCGSRSEAYENAEDQSLSLRWRSFSLEDIVKTADCNLDMSWAGELPPNDDERNGVANRIGELSDLIEADLQLALEQIRLFKLTGPPSK